MFYTYILQSLKSKRYYTGSTSNLKRRIIEHNNGKNISTKNKGPYKIIYTENFSTLKLARKREYQIKSYKSGEAFKKLVGD